jgi:hypothetical protein
MPFCANARILRRKISASACASPPLLLWSGNCFCLNRFEVSGGQRVAASATPGDFVNTTGDAVCDGTLKQGPAAQLEQSPYLNILAEERVREALLYMGRAPEERVANDIGREFCQRQAVKALIDQIRVEHHHQPDHRPQQNALLQGAEQQASSSRFMEVAAAGPTSGNLEWADPLGRTTRTSGECSPRSSRVLPGFLQTATS